MRVENKKMVLLIALATIAPLTEIIVLLDVNLRKETGMLSFCWLEEIGFFHWDWLLVFVFAGTSLVLSIWWRSGDLLLRGIIVIVSVIALVVALPFFLIQFFFKM
ncbi:MAG TPA: hypothetical protein PLP05_01095 [Sedimentisphaerales bacterium]|nr:hypothetical protein [Sedimentisphaerales bacterium]